MIERILNRLADALKSKESRRQLVKTLLRWMRYFVRFLTVAYAVALVLAVIALGFIGEKNITTGFILYLPRIGFLLPLPFLMVFTLLFDWKMIPIQLATGIAFFFFGMSWQKGPGQPSEKDLKDSLTILTYNRGQHANQSLQPFKNLTKPDILVLQDAPNRASRYAEAEGYEEFLFQESIGKFTILSRFPILGSELIQFPHEDGRELSLAARFEIKSPSGPIAVYSVHFRSPRDMLRYYSEGAFLYGILGIPGTPLNGRRKENQKWWNRRIDQARILLEQVERDELPVIVVGDFNAPAGGFIHRLMTEDLKDAHLEAGSGFGYTFPGKTRNPLSAGGPWMRIDYIFHSDDWTSLECLTEQDRPSQHRAVAASLALENQ